MQIAIAGSQAEFTERVSGVLGAGTKIVPCSVESLSEGSAGDFDAIILGSEIPVQDALKTAQTLDSTRPDIGVVVVAEPHPRVLRAALLAGARDVWSPDMEVGELQMSMERVLAASARRKTATVTSSAPTARTGHQVIVVLSPKGGAGKTTIATNLAAGVAMATDEPVGLVDLDLQFGDVAPALGLAPEHTMADAIGVLDNPTALKTMLAPHRSGVHTLCCPENPADADRVTPVASTRVVELMAAEFRTTVIDTAAGLDEHTLGALDMATDLLMVSTTDIFAINGTRKLLDILEQIDFGEPDRHLVLNRANARVDIERPEIEKTLNWSIDVEIPSTRAVPLAMNRGDSLYEVGRVARRPMVELLSRFIDVNNGGDLRRVGR
ncbi:MAG: AAA family ATPase [Acidimicrobiales bacterium]